MALVGKLFRLQWGGALATTESWSCSLHVNTNTDPGLSATAFAPALKTWMSPGSAMCSSSAKLDEIKFNELTPVLLPNGKISMRYALQTSNTAVVSPSTPGSGTPGPSQCSLVASTRTDLARGPAHAGRFYPPSPALAISSDGRVIITVAADAALAHANLLKAINALLVPSGGHVVVFSVATQTAEVVTGVRVGRVIDTMRSRRTSLIEDPQTSSV